MTTVLRKHPKTLAEQYPRYGYPALHDMLRAARHMTKPQAHLSDLP